MADDHEPRAQQPDTVKAVYVQGSHGTQVGDNTIQLNVNIYAEGTWSARPPQPSLGEEGSPYRGLLAFEEHDARFFFGRDDAIDEVMERMTQCAAGPGLLMAGALGRLVGAPPRGACAGYRARTAIPG